MKASKLIALNLSRSVASNGLSNDMFDARIGACSATGCSKRMKGKIHHDVGGSCTV